MDLNRCVLSPHTHIRTFIHYTCDFFCNTGIGLQLPHPDTLTSADIVRALRWALGTSNDTTDATGGSMQNVPISHSSAIRARMGSFQREVREEPDGVSLAVDVLLREFHGHRARDML